MGLGFGRNHSLDYCCLLTGAGKRKRALVKPRLKPRDGCLEDPVRVTLTRENWRPDEMGFILDKAPIAI